MSCLICCNSIQFNSIDSVEMVFDKMVQFVASQKGWAQHKKKLF